MKKVNQILFIVFAALLLFLFAGEGVKAQDVNPDIEIPFIDRDGDGINDLLQHGWGTRFIKRYKKRQVIWEQLNVEIIKAEDGVLVDTDGKGDIPMKDFMKNKMDEQIDTDGDGKPDTALKDYLGRKFKGFDRRDSEYCRCIPERYPKSGTSHKNRTGAG